MCGIVGFFGPGDQRDLEAMRTALVHRGPDGSGTYADPDRPLFLGHNRLAIIDLAGGAQPMQDAEGSIVVVFNGEIYNHLELRRDLEALGCRFRTDHSDTEVLVHGWRVWGKALPEKLNGMFAFAILDRRTRELFLARDRFGEKPLYWARQGELFAFASEITALPRHRHFTARYDRAALKKYFAHGFIPAPNAAFEDTRKLPGGGWLRFGLEDGRIDEGRYWRYRVEPREDGRSEDDLAEELRGLIETATQRRLMSDVPIGVFLSGGIDSSIVTACAAACMPRDQVSTFAIGFSDPHFDESRFARIVAEHLGVAHHERVLDMEAARALVPEVLARLDEPMADPSLLPTYLLCRFTREQVTVALSGDGGDELFCGYDTFAALKPAQLYHALVPGALHRTFRWLSRHLPQSPKNMSFDFKVRRALKGIGHGPALWNPTWLAPLEVEEIRNLFCEDVDEREVYSEVLEEWHGSPDLGINERTQEFYVKFYLQDGILTKVDRASMMNSLETRAVFLDPDVVEFARTLPTRLKINGAERKYLLKRAFADVLPNAIVTRPKKGFGVPLLSWFRDAAVSQSAASVIGVDQSYLEGLIAAHRDRRDDHRLFLWAWLVVSAVALRRTAG